MLDGVTNSNKDYHLIAYVRLCSKILATDELLFCKLIEDKATAFEVFNILNNFSTKHCWKIVLHYAKMGLEQCLENI